jgi:hypothetical protein
MVEKEAARGAVNHNTNKAKLADRSIELACGGFRILQVDGGKGGETLGVGLDRGGQSIVQIPRKRGSRGGVKTVHVAAGKREHLHVDTGGIHGGEAPGPEVYQLLANCADVCIHEAALVARVHGLKIGRSRGVFLEGDGTHERTPSRGIVG